MRGYCVIQFLRDSQLWCFICSSRIHMGDDMSKILNYFDIWLVTCRIFRKFSTYGWWRVEDFRNFRHMAGVLFLHPPAPRRAGGSFLWVRRLAAPAANSCILRYFFWKSAPTITPWKKKRFYGLFLRFCLHLWVFAVTLRRVMRYVYVCGGPTFSL